MIKTFRGILADGAQDRIRLQTIKGKVGYKIVKFQIVSENPTSVASECVVQVWNASQGTPVSVINFTDSNLLAAGIWTSIVPAYQSRHDYVMAIMFDKEIFNQDIFITNDSDGERCNYYLELEVIPLDDAGAEYTTLKDMR